MTYGVDLELRTQSGTHARKAWVDIHEIQISTIDNFIVIIIVISTFVDS